MAFHDLPDDWPQRPLTDPRLLADVLDLVVTAESRYKGALYLLFCDAQDRLLQPFAIDGDCPADGEERARVLRNLLPHMEELVPGGSLLVAIARRDGLSATADDELWGRAALSALTTWRLLGVHVVTMQGSRPVPCAAPAP